jgi:hypothetical protein
VSYRRLVLGSVPWPVPLNSNSRLRQTAARHAVQAGCSRRRCGVIPGYTMRVKTAISVPDDTFERATKQAAELGISRSEFFARAARRYLDELASRSLTQQVDEALQAAGGDDSAAAAVAAGRRRLAAEDDW